jgi:hypothetical protein
MCMTISRPNVQRYTPNMELRQPPLTEDAFESVKARLGRQNAVKALKLLNELWCHVRRQAEAEVLACRNQCYMIAAISVAAHSTARLAIFPRQLATRYYRTVPRLLLGR